LEVVKVSEFEVSLIQVYNFYEEQRDKLFKDGITTVYGNYFSGKFFQVFFRGIETDPDVAYYFLVHLQSKTNSERLVRLFINKYKISNKLYIVQTRLQNNISNGKYSAEIGLSRDSVMLPKRKQLESSLLKLSELLGERDVEFAYQLFDTEEQVSLIDEFKAISKKAYKLCISIRRMEIEIQNANK
jgi:hypothetical protein